MRFLGHRVKYESFSEKIVNMPSDKQKQIKMKPKKEEIALKVNCLKNVYSLTYLTNSKCFPCALNCMDKGRGVCFSNLSYVDLLWLAQCITIFTFTSVLA